MYSITGHKMMVRWFCLNTAPLFFYPCSGMLEQSVAEVDRPGSDAKRSATHEMRRSTKSLVKVDEGVGEGIADDRAKGKESKRR